MIDVPKISQRSIIAFCDCSHVGDNQSNHIWVKVPVWASLSVSSLTAATLKVNGGADAIISAAGTAKGIKVAVNGNGVDAYAYLSWSGYPYERYGYDDQGNFTLAVTTAGDAQRGIEGTTMTFAINVLMLGIDMPHVDKNLLFFRVGEKVDSTFDFINTAREWIRIGVQTGFPAGGGDGNTADIVSNVKVGGNYAQSGLEVKWTDAVDGYKTVTLYGTAVRPGIYRVEFDLESKEDSSHVSVIHPYGGGRSTTVVCICIYEPYQPGNVVVMLPAPGKTAPSDALRVVHSPFFTGGYGEFLTWTNLTHYKTDDYDHWSAVVPQYGITGSAEQEVIASWCYRIQNDGTQWTFLGYHIEAQPGVPGSGYIDPDEFASMTHPEIIARATNYSELATAALRGFDDEQPPKQGWSAGQYLVLTGDLTGYVAPETVATNGGWYNYAGKIEYTPAASQEVPEPDPVTVDIYERSIHYIAGADGWYPEELKFAGARYLAFVGEMWRATSQLPTSAILQNLAEWTAVNVQRTDQETATPYCPGKAGDFGVMVPTDAGDVFHSLSNQFSGEMLRVVLDNIAGAQWEFYPMRRLLDLFATGASVTVSVSYNSDARSEIVGGDFGNSWGGYSDYHDTSAPSVEQVQTAINRTIKAGGYSSDGRTVSGKSLSYSVSHTLSLDHSVWDEKRLLSELCGVVTNSGGQNISGTLHVYSLENSVVMDKYSVYKLRRPKNDPACAPWDPNYEWEMSAVTGEMTAVETTYYAEYDEHDGHITGYRVKTLTWHETYSFSNGSWNATGTYTEVETGRPPITSTYTPTNMPGGAMHVGGDIYHRAQTDGSGVVHPDGYMTVYSPGFFHHSFYSDFGLGVNDTGSVAKTGNESWSGGPYYDGDNYWTQSVTATATTTFVQKARNPWNFDDPGADYDDWVNLEVYVSEEKNFEQRWTNDGPSADGSTVTDKMLNMQGRVFFGEGRDSNDPHRPVVLSASGNAGWGGSLAVDDAENVPYTYKNEKTYDGIRTHSANPDDNWSYNKDAPDGTTMTDGKWGVLFTLDEDELYADLTGDTASLDGNWSFATGLVKRMVLAILSGTSFSGGYTVTRKAANCSGSYNDEDTQEYVEWSKSGTRDITHRAASELPEYDDEESSGDDPDEIAPDESAPRDHTVSGAFWSTTRSEENLNCSFTVNVRDETGLPQEN